MSRPEHLIFLANKKLIRDSAEIEAEITSKGPGYLTTLYVRCRDDAAEALAALAYVDADDPKHVRTLQNELLIFDRICEKLRSVVADGIMLDGQEAEDARQEVQDIILERAEHEPDLHGLIDTGMPDS